MLSTARATPPLVPSSVRSDLAPSELDAPPPGRPDAPAGTLPSARLAAQPPVARAIPQRPPEALCIPLRARHCMTAFNCLSGTVGALGGACVGLLVDLAALASGMEEPEATAMAVISGTGSGLLLGLGLRKLLELRDRVRVTPAVIPPAVPPAVPPDSPVAPAPEQEAPASLSIAQDHPAQMQVRVTIDPPLGGRVHARRVP